jgi:hypothetical protein
MRLMPHLYQNHAAAEADSDEDQNDRQTFPVDLSHGAQKHHQRPAGIGDDSEGCRNSTIMNENPGIITGLIPAAVL